MQHVILYNRLNIGSVSRPRCRSCRNCDVRGKGIMPDF